MPRKSIFTKANFEKGLFKLGLKKDSKDVRDYQFSDLIKSKLKTKKITKTSIQTEPMKRGCYRKPNYFKPVIVKTTKTVVVKDSFSLPSSIDHTDSLSKVKNQMNLGSCVSFAAVAMKESQEKQEHDREVLAGKKDHRKGKEYDYSEAWVYWNCKKIDEWPGEEGTDLRSAMKVLNKIGVPTEKAWPYTDDILNIGEPEKWADLIARWASIGSYWSINSLEELKTALVDSPVMIGVPVFEEWMEPVKGVISYPQDPDYVWGGHAICVCSYNDNTKLVKFKNSWSSYWGDKGYGYLSYRYINDFLWSAWVAKDISVTKDMLKGTRELI